MKNFLLKSTKYVKRNLFVFLLLIPPLIFIFFDTQPILNIDINMVIFIIVLLLIIEGIKESNAVAYISYLIIKKSYYLPILYINIILITVFISMFLTNDITLFIMIPIAISVERLIKTNMIKIMILIIIAVNVGSALTPIGNPQNIFLWHLMNIKFFQFIKIMFPVFVIMFLLLIVFTLIFSKKQKINKIEKTKIIIKKDLFVFSLINLILFIFFIPKSLLYLFIISIIIYYIFYRSVIKKFPINIVIIFVLIIIDLNILTYIMQEFNYYRYLNNNIFVSGVILSQIISNFPASVFLSKISNNYKMILLSVNIAGNGTFVASLANLIGLKLINRKDSFLLFHLISFSFLFIILLLYYFILD